MDDLDPAVGRFGRIPPRRHPEARFRRYPWRRAFREDRHPLPTSEGPFVGIIEITCGTLIIVGLLTRLAAIPLIAVMIVALVSTKLPILLGHEVGMFSLPDLKRYGFWSAQHEARADLTMLLGCIYLLIEGGGRWSIDAKLGRSRQRMPLLSSA